MSASIAALWSDTPHGSSKATPIAYIRRCPVVTGAGS
jgi:hypothetical protein